MTREEAIDWLKAISFVSDPHITEALNMAIEALSEDKISRSELFNKLAVINAPMEANEYKAEVYKIINEL